MTSSPSGRACAALPGKAWVEAFRRTGAGINGKPAWVPGQVGPPFFTDPGFTEVAETNYPIDADITALQPSFDFPFSVHWFAPTEARFDEFIDEAALLLRSKRSIEIVKELSASVPGLDPSDTAEAITAVHGTIATHVPKLAVAHWFTEAEQSGFFTLGGSIDLAPTTDFKQVSLQNPLTKTAGVTWRPFVAAWSDDHPLGAMLLGAGTFGIPVLSMLAPEFEWTGRFVFPLDWSVATHPDIAQVLLDISGVATENEGANPFGLPQDVRRALTGELEQILRELFPAVPGEHAAGQVEADDRLAAALRAGSTDLGVFGELIRMQTRLAELASGAEDAIDRAFFGLVHPGQGLTLPSVFFRLFPILPIALELSKPALAKEIASKIAEFSAILQRLAEHVAVAADPRLGANDAAARLLFGISEAYEAVELVVRPHRARVPRTLPFLFQLTPDDLESVVRSLSPTAPITQDDVALFPGDDEDQPWKELKPSPALFVAPADLDVGYGDSARVGPLAWLTAARHAIDYALALELAAKLFSLTCSAESAWFVLTGQLGYRSGLALMLRAKPAWKELGDVLVSESGVVLSASHLAAFYWKQLMADDFLQAAAADGHDIDCLYEVFRWMETPENRDVLDAVLGVASFDGSRSARARGAIWDQLFRENCGEAVKSCLGIGGRFGALYDSRTPLTGPGWYETRVTQRVIPTPDGCVRATDQGIAAQTYWRRFLDIVAQDSIVAAAPWQREYHGPTRTEAIGTYAGPYDLDPLHA